MIGNGANKPLNNTFPNLPNVGGALNAWFRPMTFTLVTKEIVNYVVVETLTDVNFRGVWQALGSDDLRMLPEGQRNWSWWQVHSDTSLDLKLDDIIFYQEIRHRVMKKIDHSGYGFFEYHIMRDYQDAT
jgi:hypothetical protein